MAEMILYTYSDKTKALFQVSDNEAQKIERALQANVVSAFESLCSVCTQYLSGFDASQSDNWAGLVSKPQKALSRYAQGQQLVQCNPNLKEELQYLQKICSDLSTQREQILAMIDLTEPANAFLGFFDSPIGQLFQTIDSHLTICLSGLNDVSTALSSEDGENDRQAQRVVGRWIAKVRRLDSQLERLKNKIQSALTSLSHSEERLCNHILANSRTSTRNLMHREIFYWCAKFYDEDNSSILAQSFAANGFENNRWARDLYYRTEANYYSFADENGEVQSSYITDDTMYIVKWLEDNGMGFPSVENIDVQDLVLSSIDRPPVNKLFNIIIDYIDKPTGMAHTLEGEPSESTDLV